MKVRLIVPATILLARAILKEQFLAQDREELFVQERASSLENLQAEIRIDSRKLHSSLSLMHAIKTSVASESLSTDEAPALCLWIH